MAIFARSGNICRIWQYFRTVWAFLVYWAELYNIDTIYIYCYWGKCKNHEAFCIHCDFMVAPRGRWPECCPAMNGNHWSCIAKKSSRFCCNKLGILWFMRIECILAMGHCPITDIICKAFIYKKMFRFLYVIIVHRTPERERLIVY